MVSNKFVMNLNIFVIIFLYGTLKSRMFFVCILIVYQSCVHLGIFLFLHVMIVGKLHIMRELC